MNISLIISLLSTFLQSLHSFLPPTRILPPSYKHEKCFPKFRSSHKTPKNTSPLTSSSLSIKAQGDISEIVSIGNIKMPKSTFNPLAIILLSQFLLFIGVGAVIPTIPIYGKELGLSSAANGIVISTPALALLALAKIGGEYADRARKPAMLWGMTLIAISDFGTALAQGIWPLIFVRLGLGAGRCISESGERGYIADLASTIPEYRGRILATQNILLSLGVAIGAPAGGYIVEQFGPRAAFLCVTAGALLALLLYSFLPETKTYSSERSETNPDTKDASSNNKMKWSELLQDDRWKGLSLFEMGAKFGFAVKIACVPIIAAKVLPGGAVGAGTLLSAAGLSGLVGAPIGGLLVDKIGAKSTIIISGIVASLGLITVPLALNYSASFGIVAPSWILFSACILLWSLAVTTCNPATTALAQQYSRKGSEATSMALPRAAGDLVNLFAPFLLGFIADYASFPMGSDCFFAGVCGLFGILAFVLL